MNVLFLSHAFPRYIGDPAGSFVLRLAKALEKVDVKVHVVAPSSNSADSTDEVDGITVERFRYAPRRYEKLAYTGNMATEFQRSWSAKVTMLGFLGADFAKSVMARRRVAPDLIHAHWWFPGGLVGTWLGGLSHLPLVTTLHGTDVRLAKGVAVARPLFRHVITHSAKVTTVSHWLAGELDLLVPNRSPVVAPMPVATELFEPDGTRPRDGILFVGRLNAQKGLDRLIRALAGMKTKATLDVVGDGPARESLGALAAELGVADRMRWHGQVRQGELPKFYQRACVLAVPSIDEGLGLVAVEAALCETPVVGFRSGGTPDVVRDGSTGILVEPNNVPALSAALDDLLNNAPRAASMGQSGRLYALANFAPESAAQKYLSIYQQAIDGYGS
ncbi:MAG: glycosyltransferase [Gemmatimonadaceae bacterium]|nr:glycosyltransferase [Gemmatimonadaceae bacterium]